MGFFLAACSFFSAPDDTFEKNLKRSSTTLPLASNFESIRQNIIRPKCARCHQPDSPTDASKILFSTEDQLLNATNDEGKILIPGNAKDSIFFKVMSSEPQVRGVSEAMPPEKEIRLGRSRAVTYEELKVIQLWIEGLRQGDPSDDSASPPVVEPSPTPPIGPISGDLWSQVQQHVLASRCVTCHKAGGKAEKLPLETKAQVLNGMIDGQPMVVAGKPLESPFFQVLNDDNSLRQGFKKMPPLKAVASGRVSDVTELDRKIVRDCKDVNIYYFFPTFETVT